MKDRTVCKNRYNKNRRKNNNITIIENETCTSHQETTIDNVNNKKEIRNFKVIFPEKRKNNNNASDSAYENRRQVIIGPRNVGKTYYLL